jgi:hypothetical protein
MIMASSGRRLQETLLFFFCFLREAMSSVEAASHSFSRHFSEQPHLLRFQVSAEAQWLSQRMHIVCAVFAHLRFLWRRTVTLSQASSE